MAQDFIVTSKYFKDILFLKIRLKVIGQQETVYAIQTHSISS